MIKQILILLALVLLTTSCSQVNLLTRTKRVPRYHSMNYCVEGLKAPKSDVNKGPWVVYYDKTGGKSFNNAGGKVKAEDVDYLQAFYVIGKKKGYLELIKYAPEIINNGKLDYKAAEYYGWIPETDLLLERQSTTDLRSGKAVKMMIALQDSSFIHVFEQYFDVDSVKLYKDHKYEEVANKVAMFSLVYKLKESADGQMSLISKTPNINPDAIADQVLGWINSSMLQDIGTGLHIDRENFVRDASNEFVAGAEKVKLSEDMEDGQLLLSEQNTSLKYSPVFSYSTKDTLVAFKSALAQPAFDYSDNYIFNVDGNQITYKEYRKLAKELRNINITFVFGREEQTITHFPQLVNALQNLQPLFEESGNYKYQFRCVMSFDDSKSLSSPLTTPFTADYSQLLAFLSEKANQKDKLRAMRQASQSWSGLQSAVKSLEDVEGTNLIVLIGDQREQGIAPSSRLKQQLIDNNCRLLGFQIYAGDGNEYNNFVLDVEDMINSYASGMLKTKRDILVSPQQIRRDNYYVSGANHKNTYLLDYPENSITQGALFFPAKSEYLPMEILTQGVDTIVHQIQEDNISVMQYMLKAFRIAGNNRTKLDSLFANQVNHEGVQVSDKSSFKKFVEQTPGWFLPTDIIVMDEQEAGVNNYQLLASADEQKELKDFIENLSKLEVESINQSEGEDKQKRKTKPCDCEDEDLFALLDGEATANTSESNEAEETPTATTDTIKYIKTKKVRRHLKKSFMEPIRYCKPCKEKRRDIKRMSLADAQYRVSGVPTSTELLDSITIKQLKRKRKLSDEDLEFLVNYYKEMKSEIDKSEQFDSNGESYYCVGGNLLP
ncbi:MAG: type VI secretion system protein TssR domain-containing protein [Bacteroidales bacterium]